VLLLLEVDVLLPVLLLLLPPSGGGTQGPHVPRAVPSGWMQVDPTQQSASTVHPPQVGTHDTFAQMYGGVPPSAGFGTHGSLLQQLALVAHAPPSDTHCIAAQRGTPTESGLQVSWVWQLPAQQSYEALHDIVCSLQMSPSGLQPVGLRHTPTVKPVVMAHVTVPFPPGSPAAPQQSMSFVHRSPTTWHPLAGWQTRTPVGP
jgi:hypothetical protein